VVQAPKSNGGLGIWDPSIMNKSLGTKILWRLVIGHKEWWKIVLNHKYFPGYCLRCLDDPPSPHAYSLILCLSMLPFTSSLIISLGLLRMGNTLKYGRTTLWEYLPS